MNIHEYQGKAILSRFGVSVPAGIVADSVQQAQDAAKELETRIGTTGWVVKAQIHAGGRGKGGGVKLARNPEEAFELAKRILGMTLVTPQTGPQGRVVQKV